MNETVSQGPEAVPRAEIELAAERGRRGRGRWVALGAVVVVLAGGVWIWRAGVFSPAASPGRGAAPSVATAVVARRDLSAVLPVTATLGYAGSYPVTGQGSGRLTWLPAPGTVVHQGEVLYRVDDGTPVVLLYGTVPAWRALSEGMTGHDVAQLNRDLVRLGHADRADVAEQGWDHYSWETAAAMRRLKRHLGVSLPSGSLPLGQVVFEPEALRISRVTGRPGGPAAGPVLASTSDRHVVTIPLAASDQSRVGKGDKVTVTLPDGADVPGVISWVGTVATVAPGSGGSSNATIPVQVTLTDPRPAGRLDQAPVTVNIVTGTAHDVLVVPVTALMAQASGGYVVEVAGPGSSRRYVPVTVGPTFDDSDGLVQVTGALVPGQRVVVASS
ncbi:peptidoglycan-binding protein [Actinomadura sp. NPDC048394]|uniref:efflux RND transporter periplasmic adaptor subunit n=1 Tax=Actinomadura sp. NPDC048394 TaxID=3158223 RepID=UPI003410C666